MFEFMLRVLSAIAGLVVSALPDAALWWVSKKAKENMAKFEKSDPSSAGSWFR